MQVSLARQLITSLRRLLRSLPSRRGWQLVVCVLLMLLSAVSEVAALGLVVPLLATLADPNLLFQNGVGQAVAASFGFSNPQQLSILVVLAFVAAAIAAAVIRIAVLWANTRLVNAIGADLGAEAFRRILQQQYAYHLAHNTSDVSAGITRKVDAIVSGLLQPLLTLVSSTVIILAILFALLFIDVVIAVTAFVAFGTGYLVLALLSRRAIARSGETISSNYAKATRALHEGLKGIRDVLLSGTQSKYVEIFRAADRPLRRAQGAVVVIGQSARYVMEAFGMAVIAGLAVYLVMSSGRGAVTIATLGALALGGQRLLPMLQHAFSAWASIVAYRSVLEDVLAMLELPIPSEANERIEQTLTFTTAVEFKDVHFRYETGDDWVLKGLNLSIPRGSRVGIIGATGSGKTTTTDLFMGLLFPTSGQILVDGVALDQLNIASWRKHVTHVPQSIYLMDGTFSENIALGDAGLIDLDRVQRSAALARIDDFILRNDEAYAARVGEDGAWLSGGQRQRIGIARALYKRADVLVLDEATSALDTKTEASVMEAIASLDSLMTVVIVAHRLTTLQQCEIVVRLEKGVVAAIGTYDQVVGSAAGPS